ncbi:Hypothetical_protein [Hexamita inflata]|uniref:Hypothetical_protein n=1 Tax=Hexamita inflata TaxID=28002 RepID=A0AA86UWX3_9EUKA|nr:Hypothetical protein HINF_LOCUS62880 [Hexamita inflata]CAI9975239.1 Hypothetical protein HINF_LOCUS62884 [Hexamita inflata]
MDSFAAQVLHKYHDLTNMEFKRAIDIKFDSDWTTDQNHAIFCSAGAGYAIKRYNKAQYDLVEHLQSKYKPQLSQHIINTVSPKKGINMTQKTLQMNEIEYQNKNYFWDLRICQNNSTMNREYQSKLETHAKNYKVLQDQILSLIITDHLLIILIQSRTRVSV